MELFSAISILTILFILVVIYGLVKIIYNLTFNPLSRYPGPKAWGATIFPNLYSFISGRLPHGVRQLHEKYGPVVRIGPHELSYITGKAWSDIYGHRQGLGQMAKDNLIFQPPLNGVNSIISADNATHARFRRLMSHAFSEKALRSQEPVIQFYVSLLMQRLRENCNDGQMSLDMVRWMNYTTFDLIGDLTFSDPFECLKKSTYHPWVEIIWSSVKANTFFCATKRIPGLERFLALLMPRDLIQKKKDHQDMAISKVTKRLQDTEPHVDFMSYILRHNDEKGMTVPEIEANADLLLIAGSETTGTLLSGCIYNLLRNPRVLEKLTKSVRDTFKTEDEININRVAELKYMLAVLEESARIYPAVPSPMPRYVPSGPGEEINGKWVPGGTLVSVNPWAAYHSNHNWTDPELFYPERWLGDPRYALDKQDSFQPFSIGPRACIGRNLAYAEMRLILGRLVWNFDMKLAAESEDWAIQPIYVLWEKGPLNVYLKSVR